MTVSPASTRPLPLVSAGVPADLVSDSVDRVEVGVLVVSGADVTGAPVGGVPDAVAELSTAPAFTSACVTVYVAVQVVLPPGCSVVTGQLAPVTLGSLTTTPVSVWAPVLVTRNV